MFEFLNQLTGLVIELNRLLGTRFIPGHPSNDSAIGKSVLGIYRLHNAGNFEHRDYEILKLTFFVKHLKEIEVSKPELLRYFKKELRRTGSTDSFFGLRFEVNIAASLIRHSVKFTKRESPDFSINNTPLAIECSSVRIRGNDRKPDYNYKLASCIREKEGKGYHDLDTVLAIDVTNIAYNADTLVTEEMRSVIVKSVAEKSFGSVLLFYYMLNRKPNQIESVYIRVDHPSISEELRTFLHVHFPYGQHEISDYSIPYEG
jgi:hypothetical protein